MSEKFAERNEPYDPENSDSENPVSQLTCFGHFFIWIFFVHLEKFGLEKNVIERIEQKAQVIQFPKNEEEMLWGAAFCQTL